MRAQFFLAIGFAGVTVLAHPAIAGQWITLPTDTTQNPHATSNGAVLTITEKAAPGLPVQVYLSYLPQGAAGDTAIATPINQKAPVDSGTGTIRGGAVALNGQTVWGGTGKVPAGGTITFIFSTSYNGHKVTDYHQQTGDPGILSAAAFANGFMIGLEDFLSSGGYTSDATAIVQPDFALASGDPIFYAVDLAQLGGTGAALANANSFGTDFTIGANDTIPGLTGYQFSTTMPVYAPGQGWQVTPVAPGTVVTYDAYHATSVPEPASLLMLTLGLGGAALAKRRALPQ